MDEDIVIPLAGMAMVIIIVLGFPIVRMLVKRWERSATPVRGSSDDSQRLARIEQAVDAMSIEVERIAEGQRFVTRLLGDRAAAERVGIPSSSDRTT